MIVSLDWIKEFIHLNESPQEIADKITLSLSEVEKIEKKGEDTVLEIENKALTHRPDCFSQLGLAREIGAYFAKKIKDPLNNYYNYSFPKPKKAIPLKVKLDKKDLCLRYTTIVLTNIRVGESPKFIQERLKSVNIRPINSVVDITNYVMMELGQPLHAFDYEKINNHTIIVRSAKKGETITTLDGVKRHLNNTMLVIANSEKAVALAGIIGGKESEVTQNTKTIILESASFNSQATRKTAKKLGVRTEASTRFEKNLDPHFAKAGMVKAVELLEKYAGARIASRFFDLRDPLPEKKVIVVKATRINTVLGLNLTACEMKKLLARLELETRVHNNDLTITIPTYRRDLGVEADIAEEVARIYGYDEIPTTLPKGDIIPPLKNRPIEMQHRVKLVLSGLGLFETHLPSLIGKDVIERIGNNPKEYVKLINPTSPEKEYFRRSLIESLILAGNFNSKYTGEFSLFEVGRVYEKTPDVKVGIPTQSRREKEGVQPTEKIKIGGIFIYPKKEDAGNSFFIVKGIIEELFNQLGVPMPITKPVNNSQLYQEGIAAKIETYGTVGKLNPELSSFIIKEGSVFTFELDFDMLLDNQKGKYYHPIPQNPPVIEDFTFEFKTIPLMGELVNIIKSVDIIISQVDILDTYNNTITVRIYFQDPKKSLSSKDIVPIREMLIKEALNKLEGTIKTKS